MTDSWGNFAPAGSPELSPAEQFLQLLKNPFKASFQVNAFWASLSTSLGISALLTLLFSLFRPHHTVVYAPKLKHADQKHMPPPIGKGYFAWITPVLKTKEQDLVDRVGLDAVVFLRFAKMCRNIFLVLSVLGCTILIPINLTNRSTNWTGQFVDGFARMTPLHTTTNAMWSQVVCAYVFDIVVAYFLWRNYRAVRALRRRYYQSSEYQMSLHARTLMVTDIPPSHRSDEGLLRLTDEVNPTGVLGRATVGRNVKDLPVLIKKHEEAVRKLEAVLAKYLKNPDRLPPNRPTMRPSRTGEPVDAIDYLTERIQELEARIRDVRQSVDRRNPMPYGFVSWEAIEHAHAVAYASRDKRPHGSIIRLAPRPNDIIWDNLPLSPSARRWRRVVNIFWATLLTVVWIAPNAMIAIFLSDLSNLGLVWPAFQISLQRHHHFWAAVQGIAAPALTSLIYLVLPIFFRRLLVRAGDLTKTSRERHVLHYLYFFFIFNNLIVFSLFSAGWAYVSAVIDLKNSNKNAWEAIRDGHLWYKAATALCQISPFWVTWLLQRNLGAAIDLTQLFSIITNWWQKTFMSPTPRRIIEWSAPPWFDYASYYNYFLFYATVALCFATLQPIVLPVTTLYFGVDVVLKKYLLMYVFITKTESGGRFWRVLFNRMVFAVILSNLAVALMVKANGTYTMLFSLIPLPFLMLGFKWYCSRTFDPDIEYYNRVVLSDEALHSDLGKGIKRAAERLSSRFGHPALYKPLITPMVHARAAEALKSIYRGRLGEFDTTGDYSDIAMQSMSTTTPGKTKPSDAAPFEMVSENQLDFSYFKDRADFRDEFGGGIYGRPDDLISERSQTPRPIQGGDYYSVPSRSSSPALGVMSSLTGSTSDLGEMRHYTQSPLVPPVPPVPGSAGSRPQTPTLYQQSNESQTGLLSSPQAPPLGRPGIPSMNRWLGGYGPVAQDEPTSYDHFRRG